MGITKSDAEPGGGTSEMQPAKLAASTAACARGASTAAGTSKESIFAARALIMAEGYTVGCRAGYERAAKEAREASTRVSDVRQ